MTEADVELTEFLVRQHLTMSHLSQRRDLTDPEVIARFAERDRRRRARSSQLYLLTLCDTAMTAPDNLTAWKDELLRDLMLRTRALLRAARGDRSATDRRRASRARARSQRAARRAGEPPAIERGRRDRADRRRHRSAPVHPAHAAPGRAPRPARRERAARAAPPVALEVQLLPAEGPQRARDRRARRARRARRDRRRADREPGRRARRRARPRRSSAGGARARRSTCSSSAISRATRSPTTIRAGTRLGDDLRELLAGGRPDPDAVAALIARRRPPSRHAAARDARRARPRSALHDDSTQATIVEVFTRDRVGVLLRDHADARRARPRHLAREGLDRGREGRRRVLRDPRAASAITDEPERAELVERLRIARSRRRG